MFGISSSTNDFPFFLVTFWKNLENVSPNFQVDLKKIRFKRKKHCRQRAVSVSWLAWLQRWHNSQPELSSSKSGARRPSYDRITGS